MATRSPAPATQPNENPDASRQSVPGAADRASVASVVAAETQSGAAAPATSPAKRQAAPQSGPQVS
jgi:hypothetical protein